LPWGALAIKKQKRDDVAICFFGDGASNEGAFHEALNMAAIWKLPVVFLCENNKYGMSVSTERSMAVTHVADRAGSYNMPGVVVDGNRIEDVSEAVMAATARARRGEGPSLIEAKTYRIRGHSKSDRNRYRTKEENRGVERARSHRPFRERAGVPWLRQPERYRSDQDFG
jgi:pyruvate dehydrogenase E1 component alpha subunit